MDAARVKLLVTLAALGVAVVVPASPAAPETAGATDGLDEARVEFLVRSCQRLGAFGRSANYDEIASLGSPAIQYVAGLAGDSNATEAAQLLQVLLNVLGRVEPDSASMTAIRSVSRRVDCGLCSPDVCLESWKPPEYVSLARIAGIEGRVRVEFDVDANGTPRNLWVERTAQGIFQQTVESAVREWKFRVDPERRDAKRRVLSVDFELVDSPEDPRYGVEMVSPHHVVVFASRYVPRPSCEGERVVTHLGEAPGPEYPLLGLVGPCQVRGWGGSAGEVADFRGTRMEVLFPPVVRVLPDGSHRRNVSVRNRSQDEPWRALSAGSREESELIHLLATWVRTHIPPDNLDARRAELETARERMVAPALTDCEFVAVRVDSLVRDLNRQRVELGFEVVSASRVPRSPGVPGVSSVERVAVVPYAERLAAGEGAHWTSDPVSIARELLGPLYGRSIRIGKEDGPGESPTTSTVTIVQEGLLDDSVAGIWQRIALERGATGWTVVSVERAFRCARGGSEEYTAELCP